MSFKRTLDLWSLKKSALKPGIIYIKIKHEPHFLTLSLDKFQLSGYNGTWIICCGTKSFSGTYCVFFFLVQRTHS
jgi:hypothetical protein